MSYMRLASCDLGEIPEVLHSIPTTSSACVIYESVHSALALK